jgi:sec-independent protein translocase protein TatA
MIPLLAFGMPAAPEWIVIGILALILFGPKKIPEIARGLGKALGELQRAKEDFQREITGVPPLPKIESPTGVQSTASTGVPPVDAGVTSSVTLQAPQSNPPGAADTKS